MNSQQIVIGLRFLRRLENNMVVASSFLSKMSVTDTGDGHTQTEVIRDLKQERG